MQVRDVMTPYAEWIDPQASIADAARMMREHDFGVLPAGGGSRLVRMITDRDMAIRAAAERSIPPRREWRPSWPRAFRNASTTSRPRRSRATWASGGFGACRS